MNFLSNINFMIQKMPIIRGAIIIPTFTREFLKWIGTDRQDYRNMFNELSAAFIGLMSYEQSSGKHKGKPKRRIVRHPAKTNLSAVCPINISLNPDI